MEKEILERASEVVAEAKKVVEDLKKSVASPMASIPSAPPVSSVASSPASMSPMFMNEDKDGEKKKKKESIKIHANGQWELEKADFGKIKRAAKMAAAAGSIAAAPVVGGALTYGGHQQMQNVIRGMQAPAKSSAPVAKPMAAKPMAAKPMAAKPAAKPVQQPMKLSPAAQSALDRLKGGMKMPDQMEQRIRSRLAEREAARASMRKDEHMEKEEMTFAKNGQWCLTKAKKNPDKEADAKLGEDVEHLVEDHMIENAEAEREEGHKIMMKDEDESNSEMAHATTDNIEHKSKKIKHLMEQGAKESPPWVVSKLAQAKAHVQDVMDYTATDGMKKKEGRCWEGYEPTPGKKPYSKGSCQPMKKEEEAKGEKGQPKVAKVMRHFSEGKLHSGKSGKIVTDPQQAKAIAMSMSGLSRKK